jgi:hypothetical protein
MTVATVPGCLEMIRHLEPDKPLYAVLAVAAAFGGDSALSFPGRQGQQADPETPVRPGQLVLLAGLLTVLLTIAGIAAACIRPSLTIC